MPVFNPAYESYSGTRYRRQADPPSIRHTGEFGFPAPSSLDYQAQHTIRTDEEDEAVAMTAFTSMARFSIRRHGSQTCGPRPDHEDVTQARSYATGPDFDRPVPFLIVSNGRKHQFYKRTETIDPADGKLKYKQIPATAWKAITSEDPGQMPDFGKNVNSSIF